MKEYESLIASYAAVGWVDNSVVEKWCAANPLNENQWGLLAERIGTSYLENRITYQVANGLMNELMPVAGWDSAPERFWEYFIAFEDGEVLEEPDENVRKAVSAIAGRAA